MDWGGVGDDQLHEGPRILVQIPPVLFEVLPVVVPVAVVSGEEFLGLLPIQAEEFGHLPARELA